jgi:hypothetical protein
MIVQDEERFLQWKKDSCTCMRRGISEAHLRPTTHLVSDLPLRPDAELPAPAPTAAPLSPFCAAVPLPPERCSCCLRCPELLAPPLLAQLPSLPSSPSAYAPCFKGARRRADLRSREQPHTRREDVLVSAPASGTAQRVEESNLSPAKSDTALRQYTEKVCSSHACPAAGLHPGPAYGVCALVLCASAQHPAHAPAAP